MRPAQIQTCQSSGGFSIPQKSPAGLSNSSPANHDVPSTTEIASTVLAILLRPCESNSTDTDVLFFSCTGRITPHPCALTTTVSCFPENLCSGSRLVITTGIRRVSLVLRLAFLNLSSAVPPLELTLHPASAVPASHTAVHTKDGERDNAFSPRAFYEIRTSELHHDIVGVEGAKHRRGGIFGRGLDQRRTSSQGAARRTQGGRTRGISLQASDSKLRCA
jgi:hypothetical protein